MTRLATTLLLCLVCSIASAEVVFVGSAVPLSDLESGMAMTVGDKVFSDFTYLATGDMPDSADINVQGIIDCDGNYGVRFQGGFVDLPGGGASDSLIGFNVSVTPGAGMLISEAHLAANLDVVGGGLALITETFIPTITNDDLTVFNNGTTSQLTDWIVFDEPVVTLPVQKDILLLADDAGVASAFSFVDQSFAQVPEPASLLLVLSSMMALTFARRR